MKYKLELWKYEPLEYEEAEAHLNQMASKGWALRDITSVWLEFACYEKQPDAGRYRYAVEVLSDQNEDEDDLEVMCRDAGWEKVLQRRNGVWFFRTKSPAARSLFSDRQSRYTSAYENYLDSSHYAGIMFCLILLVLVMAKGLWTLWQNPEEARSLTGFVIYCFAAAVLFGSELANYLWLKRVKKMEAHQMPPSRPKWLRHISAGRNYLLLLLILTGLVGGFCYGIKAEEPFRTIYMTSAVLCLPVEAVGVYIRLIWQKKVIGWSFLLMGNILFIAALQGLIRYLI